MVSARPRSKQFALMDWFRLTGGCTVLSLGILIKLKSQWRIGMKSRKWFWVVGRHALAGRVFRV